MSTIQAIRTAADAKLELVQIPTPDKVQRFDVLVRVKGVGLNPVDTKVCTQMLTTPRCFSNTIL